MVISAAKLNSDFAGCGIFVRACANIMNIAFMENRQKEILDEIRSMMRDISFRIGDLERKVAEMEKFCGAEDENPLSDEPVEVVLADSEDLPEASVPEAETGTETETEAEMETGTEVEAEMTTEAAEEAETVENAGTAEVVVEDTEDNATDDDGQDEDDDASEAQQAVIDMMSEREAWRTDMPGTSVKDIRSAISLNDRLLFINTLFAEDAVAFQNTISDLNEMSVLEEAVRYIAERHPEWDMDSEVVYRFMMAVRRKLPYSKES